MAGIYHPAISHFEDRNFIFVIRHSFHLGHIGAGKPSCVYDNNTFSEKKQ